MSIAIALKWPPTANTYWRRRGNRYFISKDGMDYRQATIFHCHKHRNAFTDKQRLRVVIDAFPPDKRRRDLDNICKCLLDSLQHAKVYEDDSQIDELIIRRRHSGFGEVLVTIEEISVQPVE